MPKRHQPKAYQHAKTLQQLDGKLYVSARIRSTANITTVPTIATYHHCCHQYPPYCHPCPPLPTRPTTRYNQDLGRVAGALIRKVKKRWYKKYVIEERDGTANIFSAIVACKNHEAYVRFTYLYAAVSILYMLFFSYYVFLYVSPGAWRALAHHIHGSKTPDPHAHNPQPTTHNPHAAPASLPTPLTHGHPRQPSDQDASFRDNDIVNSVIVTTIISTIVDSILG